MTSREQSGFQQDLERTLENRRRLRSNRNLMYWYRELYRELFSAESDIKSKRVLEIGSGTSPLKEFVPNVILSDVMKLDYLDFVFDCHEISELAEIEDRSVNVIALTNVLHHLADPIRFLRGATRKLASGGRMYLVEPYFSACSYPLYKILHHESVDFQISRPVLEKIVGPLSTSNQAMPYMIFFSRRDWLSEVADCYDLSQVQVGYYTSLSYMLTGGISRMFPVPHFVYRPYFSLDRAIARRFPRVFASFFTARLIAR